MAARYLGKPIRRNEDPRLLRGKALFVDDIDRAGMLHGAFLRSSHAHARIVKIDASRAVTVPGVAAVYTAHDLGNYWQSGPLLVPPPPIDGITFNQRTQVPLAKEVVRHVGEPIVLVIADSRYRAEDAVSVISVEYELLEPVTDLERENINTENHRGQAKLCKTDNGKHGRLPFLHAKHYNSSQYCIPHHPQ